jgi:hypothetical protein
MDVTPAAPPVPDAAAPSSPAPAPSGLGRIHRGHTRAVIAGVFVVTLILLQFKAPAGREQLVASVRTLSVAVLAFYFGSQTLKGASRGGGQS